jgi:hypothetical protein
MNKEFTLRTYWLAAILSLIIDLFIGWIDSGENWDDAGFVLNMAIGYSKNHKSSSDRT